MVFDAARRHLVLFGGDNGAPNGETWEWHDNTWRFVTANGPSPRKDHSMVFDVDAHHVVLFGGFDGERRGDTWEWDGTRWTLVSDSGPSPRMEHAMAYDADRHRLVLFGGDDGVTRGDTWEWDGTLWTPVSLSGPSARRDHTMAYDRIRHRIVLFGGNGDSNDPLTWEWDGATWEAREVGGPGVRSGHATVYDVATAGVVLFGGSDGGAMKDDTWELGSASSDCNSDGIPDECLGLREDCNGNRIPDECDIDAGFSLDCLANGIPDECENIGRVVSVWFGDEGTWNDASNWCPAVVPDNTLQNTFDVLIRGSDSTVSLDISPTLSRLRLFDEATIVVGEKSGANVRSLAVDGSIDSPAIMNRAVIRATDRKRLVLDASTIDQGGQCGVGGILEATDGIQGNGEDVDRSILEINGARVDGGTVRADGEHSEIHLIGGAELVDVCIDGVVVPDGQTGQFSGTVVNNDVLTIQASLQDTRLKPAAANAILASATGAGCVRLTNQDHSLLGDFLSAFTNAASHRIEGAGIVFGGVTNEGVIEARSDIGQRLILFPSLQGKSNSGVLLATGAGTLQIEDAVTQSGMGRLEAKDGGTVLVHADIDGTGGLLANGGTILLDRVVAAFGTCVDVPPPGMGFQSRVAIVNSTVTATHATASNDMSITGGTVSASQNSNVTFAGPVSICPAPGAVAALDLTDSRFSAGQLRACEGAELSIVGGRLTVTGSFTFANIDESDWTWGSGAVLEMTGGLDLADDDPAGYAQLEVGGVDFGVDPAGHIGHPDGFDDNFDLTILSIGPGAHVSLVDFINNGNRIDHGFGLDEALYVDTLRFQDADGRLNLDGLHLYYATLAGHPSQIVDLPRARADYDIDCDVDLADFAALQNCFGNSPAHIACRIFDADGNSLVGRPDYAIINGHMRGPGCK